MTRTTHFLNAPSLTSFKGKNWERFNWEETERAQWESFAKTADEWFKLYSNPAVRTTAVKNMLVDVQRDTVKYNQQQKLLDRIASNPNRTVTSDFSLFRIKRGSPLEKIKRTVHTASIDEAPMVALKGQGGGAIKVFCRTVTGTGRGHRHKLSNSVLIAYAIGRTPPASVDACTLKHISTRAKFFLRLDYKERGNRIYLFARWYNTKHPELAGPWSEMHQSVIY
ncbi:MAG: hypothetical protein HY063_03765 [Bacteroidetes bacterium]|nr:hypothetical protein [Bacteroidota bacterium]